MIPPWVAPTFSAVVAFAVAWTYQGARIKEAKLEHEQYVIDLRTRNVNAINDAERQREETANEYEAKLAKVKADGDAYRRCVAAGKCGVRPQMPAPAAACEVSAPVATDEARPDPVPATRESSSEIMQVVKDCAVTTLMLNELQRDIAKQLGRFAAE